MFRVKHTMTHWDGIFATIVKVFGTWEEVQDYVDTHHDGIESEFSILRHAKEERQGKYVDHAHYLYKYGELVNSELL